MPSAIYFLKKKGKQLEKLEMEINIAAAPNRKKRVLNFTAEKKRALIREVKEWPGIWDTSDPLHCNKNAVDQAWVHLSSSLGKEVIESKDAWTRIRESYRYHARASKRQKRGSSDGAALDEPKFSEEIGSLPGKWHYCQTFQKNEGHLHLHLHRISVRNQANIP
ncbi:uncharacterized protein [Eurosta solidaginis]|uniref:uncharacterized protein isoform X2 n=1 Tax=Eurosta solidaginis TaxID=178769 RepID=UPI003530F56E